MAVFWVVLSTGCDATTKIGVGGSGGDGATGAGASGAAGGQGGQGGEGGCVFENCNQGGAGAGVAGQIFLSPQNPIVTVQDSNILTIPFTATLNGADVTANVVWIFDRPEVGDIGASSTFVPTGIVGGQGTLTAKYSNAEGSTAVTVFIKKTVNSGNLTMEQIGFLDNPQGGPDQNVSIGYPYPQTFFPLGVLSPEIQWFGGNPGDGYKLRITEKYYDYVEYMTKSPPGRHIVPQADWDAIEKSGSGAQSDPLTVALGRLSGATAFDPELNTWHIAQGKLKGNIYYWELPDLCGDASTGRILRIKPDAEQVDEFFTPGGCWGCHTVSRDGKTMMATLDSGQPFPQITVDLTQDPAGYGNIQPPTPIGGTFSAFNEKSDKILVSNDGDWQGSARLRIVDAANGSILNDNAMGNMCGEPAWSPTGKKISAICNLTSSSWIFDAQGGDLMVADVADDGFTVSNITTLVPQAGGQGRPAYPSFSPGGEFIAFGRPNQGSRTTGDGDLWLVDSANPGNLMKLAIASSDNKSFNPVFSPLRAGGYFWLVYVSRRDYGNRLQGASRQQLWITAVDDPPIPGTDPSHPPFYVRGQEDCAKSENAYMALPPCKEKGDACETGADCCEGQCVKDADTGMYVCGEPPDPGECSQDGNACIVDADCCNYNASSPTTSTTCVDGFCQPPIPE